MAFNYPVFIKRPGMKNPKKTGTYYIIAANGQFLHKKLSWVEATIPVQRIAILEDQKTEVEIIMPPTPRVILAKTVAFFREVYMRYGSEAIILLHYNTGISKWDMSVPRQQVSPGAISHYDKQERLDGHVCMGTIHSHGSGNAFHSGVDRRDEAECADGIHITIGNVNKKDVFSIDIEAVVNGHRFPLDPTWCDGVAIKQEDNRFKLGSSLFLKNTFATVECEELKGWKVPEEWMQRVSYQSLWTQKPIPYNSSTAYIRQKSEAADTEWNPPHHSIHPSPANPIHTLHRTKEIAPSLLTVAKEILTNFIAEPKRKEGHSAYCACDACRDYFRARYGDVEHMPMSTTRDGIRVVGLETVKSPRAEDAKTDRKRAPETPDREEKTGTKEEKPQ